MERADSSERVDLLGVIPPLPTPAGLRPPGVPGLPTPDCTRRFSGEAVRMSSSITTDPRVLPSPAAVPDGASETELSRATGFRYVGRSTAAMRATGPLGDALRTGVWPGSCGDSFASNAAPPTTCAVRGGVVADSMPPWGRSRRRDSVCGWARSLLGGRASVAQRQACTPTRVDAPSQHAMRMLGQAMECQAVSHAVRLLRSRAARTALQRHHTRLTAAVHSVLR